jgi:hypothetical protein
VITMTILTCEAIFLKIAHICIHFIDARNTADVTENLMVLARKKNITIISMTPLEFVEPQMARSVYICLRISAINNMTRPGLEPGISGLEADALSIRPTGHCIEVYGSMTS